MRPDDTNPYRHKRSESARITANAQARIDQIKASALPDGMKDEACADVLLMAARDLDRAAAHNSAALLAALSVGTDKVSS